MKYYKSKGYVSEYGEYIENMPKGTICSENTVLTIGPTIPKKIIKEMPNQWKALYFEEIGEACDKLINTSKIDLVNHPPHYTSDKSGVECIEITRHRNFNIGNAIKYLWRCGIKDNSKEIEDLKKAVWYIEDEIKRLENGKV